VVTNEHAAESDRGRHGDSCRRDEWRRSRHRDPYEEHPDTAASELADDDDDAVVEAPAGTELTMATRKQRQRAEAAAATAGTPPPYEKAKAPKKHARGK